MSRTRPKARLYTREACISLSEFLPHGQMSWCRNCPAECGWPVLVSRKLNVYEVLCSDCAKKR